jgi:hypothetical protein
LEKAIEHGFRGAPHMQGDSDLAILRDHPRFRELVDRAAKTPPLKAEREPQPAAVKDGVALVSDANTAVLASGVLRPLFDPGKPDPASEITGLHDKSGELLRQWWKDGTAAGNHGDFYDNRDGDHSDLSRPLFPQMAWIEYGEEAKSLQLHWGLADRIAHAAPVVIGNASVARTSGPYWRSMPRMAYTSQAGMALLTAQYFGNQVYVYPAHRDHSAGRNGKLGGEPGGHGDVFPANTPYLIASQGSSGSDRVFLEALGATLAAFRLEVKKRLIEKGAIAPTLQMIFRRSNKPAAGEDYFTGAAHPAVFEGQNIDREKMIRTAHEMTAARLPPVAMLKIVEEDQFQPGRDYFDVAQSERLFDTPSAVARVWRSAQVRRRIVVSASSSRDVNGLPLTYRWAVLRGEPRAVEITPQNEVGSLVEISLRWQPRRLVAAGADLESNRVDIGCFVYNGAWWSAPAFVTFFTLDNEDRTYDTQGRIQRVTYTGADEPGNYVDPLIALPKSWQDEYHYDSEGELTGWTRRRGRHREEFTAGGRLITKRGEDGSAREMRAVGYAAKARGGNQTPVIEQLVLEQEEASDR